MKNPEANIQTQPRSFHRPVDQAVAADPRDNRMVTTECRRHMTCVTLLSVMSE
jgi:hypothetical protein